jgi:hypothetical protein
MKRKSSKKKLDVTLEQVAKVIRSEASAAGSYTAGTGGYASGHLTDHGHCKCGCCSNTSGYTSGEPANNGGITVWADVLNNTCGGYSC